MKITTNQRKQLEDLWFIFGNQGKKHTHEGHRFIQNILERGEYDRKLYRLLATDDVVQAVDVILSPNAEAETSEGSG
jgi:hypothetical protein